MEEIIKKLNKLIDELEGIFNSTENSEIRLSFDKIERWKDRVSKILAADISQEESQKFQEKRLGSFSMTDPMRNLQKTVDLYKSYLVALVEEVEMNPEFVLGNIDTEKLEIEGKQVSPLKQLENICDKFHQVARQLRNRHDNRPTIEIEDEYDVQDLMHALLKIDFDDIRPEEWTESYAGKSSRIDFLLKNEKVVIETKKTRKGLDEKKIGDELIIDIERYKDHSDCKTLICFIYDPEGRIGNPVGLINDLESKNTDNLNVKVIIVPRT